MKRLPILVVIAVALAICIPSLRAGWGCVYNEDYSCTTGGDGGNEWCCDTETGCHDGSGNGGQQFVGTCYCPDCGGGGGEGLPDFPLKVAALA
jgi:hypothetical protein